MEQSEKIVWVILGGLIAAMTIILIACLVIDPKTESQVRVIDWTVPVTLDLFKVVVGAVVGAIGATFGRRKA